MPCARNMHLHQKCFTLQQTPSVTVRGLHNTGLLEGFDKICCSPRKMNLARFDEGDGIEVGMRPLCLFLHFPAIPFISTDYAQNNAHKFHEIMICSVYVQLKVNAT